MPAPKEGESALPWAKAIGAALAVGLSALATAIAQARIGSAAAGAIAEKPETSGIMIVLEALPETMIILGFVIAILILVLVK
ncbi:MAG: ATPase [Candidatus Edwardsbacteria bacterium]